MCITIFDSYNEFVRKVFLFIAEESKAQKEEIICLKSHSCQVAQLGFKLGPGDSIAGVFRVVTPTPASHLCTPAEFPWNRKQLRSSFIGTYESSWLVATVISLY